MRVSLVCRVVGFLILVMLLAACASVQKETVVLQPGQKTLVIKAASFKFEPNDMRARRGDVLTIIIESGSSMEHNLTMKTPKGDTLLSLDIPANGTVRKEVNLVETGTYHFYCDKPLHSSLGMKGQIEVVAP